MTADALVVLAERVLRAIGHAPVLVGDKAIPVTASAGGVVYPFLPNQHWDDALHAADPRCTSPRPAAATARPACSRSSQTRSSIASAPTWVRPATPVTSN